MDQGKTSLDQWSNMWQNDRTFWHLDKPHNYVVKHSSPLPKGSNVFIPLCGKTVDIKWFYENGFVVHGLEFEKKAIIEFFKQFNFPYTEIKLSDDITVFKTPDSKIQLFQGDFFKFNETYIDNKYDLIWDRASFVAVNFDDREKYVKILNDLLNKNGKILLSTINYQQGSMMGPPHCISPEDVRKYFGAVFEVKFLESTDISKGFPNNKSPPVTEDCYILSKL